jgi:alpha-tubulin suppressor-like RCC1 family protein
LTVTAAEARKEYAGNGVVTEFSYPYQFYQSNDLEVWLFDDATSNGTLQIIGTDYTVTGVMNPTGGTVAFAVAPPVGVTVIIINSPDITQQTHYINADDFPADSHEQALDRLTKICQRLDDRISRAVRAPDYTPEDEVPDAETLVGLVDAAQQAANDSANSASGAAASANVAQAAQAAATNSSMLAAGYAEDAETAAVAAAGSASAAAASASAAEVAKIEWQGPWNSATAYAPNDAVQDGGTSYIAKTSNTNKSPAANPADWDLLAQKGNDGTGGPGGGGGDMLAANNLSDVASISTSRDNLGLGDAAVKDVGTAAGTVAAGDDARFAALAADKVAKSGDTMTGDLTISKASPALTLNRTDDEACYLFGQKDDLDRWVVIPGNNAAESGGNAGSNFVIYRYDDAGAIIAESPFSINRQSGLITIQGDPTAALGVATKQYVDNSLTAGLAPKAPLASPVFTGNPQAPTPTAGDNDTSLATTAFVTAAIAAAGVGSELPAFKRVTALPNSTMPSVFTSHVNEDHSLWAAITADGKVRTSGVPFAVNSAAANTVAAKGQGLTRNGYANFELTSIAMPNGLLGTPVSLFYNGFDLYVLTDQGDVCVSGKNITGECATGGAAGTAIQVMTLISAANISPRSAGGASRAVVEIAHTGQGTAFGATAASVYFRCADDTLWACGYNGFGQLAQGNTTQLLVPTQCLKNDGAGNVAVADCKKVVAAGGNQGSVAYLDASGKLRLAGALRAGAVGRNTGTGSQNVFRPVYTVADGFGTLPSDYQGIDVLIQAQDTIVLRCADKCAYAWGYGAQGQMGDGTIVSKNNPLKVGVGTAVASTLNGTVERIFNSHSRSDVGAFICQLTSGAVYCWGQKSGNNLPITTADGNISTPTQAQGLLSGTPAQIMSTCGPCCTTTQGEYAIYALLASDKLLAWGNDFLDGASQSESNTANPVEVPVTRGSGVTISKVMSYGKSTSSSGSECVVMVALSDGTMLVMGSDVPTGNGETAWDEDETVSAWVEAFPYNWTLSDACIP